MPQVWLSPLLTAVKVPAGGVACPSVSSPQQATVPSVLIPQVCWPPASTLPATAPTGAVAIEVPASPVGGAPAEAVPARLRGTSAAASAARAWTVRRRTAGRLSRSRQRVRVRADCALSMLRSSPWIHTGLPPSLGLERPYHPGSGRSTPSRQAGIAAGRQRMDPAYWCKADGEPLGLPEH